jgi:hypothetical protein
MAARKTINLEEVLASLATSCSNCGYQIPPAELRRINSTQNTLPELRSHFHHGRVDLNRSTEKHPTLMREVPIRSMIRSLAPIIVSSNSSPFA